VDLKGRRYRIDWFINLLTLGICFLIETNGILEDYLSEPSALFEKKGKVFLM
jgi:hypothetical protein